MWQYISMHKTAESILERYVRRYLPENDTTREYFQHMADRVLSLGQRDIDDSYEAIEESRNYNTESYRKSIFEFLQKKYHVVPHIYTKVERDKKTVWYTWGPRKEIEELMGVKLGIVEKDGKNVQYLYLQPMGGFEEEFEMNIRSIKRAQIDKRMAREIDNLMWSYEDKLTTCHTRKYIENLANDYFPLEAWKYPKKTEKKYALIFIDIDEFKSINDGEWWYEAGDIVLHQVWQILRGEARWSDHVCRWWGDEFVIFMDVTDTEDQEESLRKYKKRIQGRLDTINSDQWDTKNPISLSLWVSPWQAWQTYQESKKNAEEEMKEHKSPTGGFRRNIANMGALFLEYQDNKKYTADFIDKLDEWSDLPIGILKAMRDKLDSIIQKKEKRKDDKD